MRLLFWVYRRLFAVRRWLMRRFTLAGGFVLAGFAFAGALTSNPEQTLGYQAFSLAAAMLVVAWVISLFFRVRFRVERRLPRFATLGEPLHYRLFIENQTSKRQAGLDYLEWFPDDGLEFRTFVDRLRGGRANRSFRLMQTPLPPDHAADARSARLPPIAPGSRIEVSAELIPLRRGPMHFAGVYIGRVDPLGLFRGVRRLVHASTVMVLPRRYSLPALALPGRTRYQRGGIAFASGIGESEEFVALREYRRGDSLRRVHWRVSARIGRPVVREYQDEFFMRHALVLDTFCDASLDAVFEEAVSVAASFACTVPDQESLLDLLFVGPRTVCVTTGRGVSHAEQMLEVLACARPCRGPNFSDLENLVLGHSGRVSGCILVLLDWDAARRRLVKELRHRRIPVWALLLSRPGAGPGPAIEDPLEYPDRLVRIEIGRVPEGLRRLETRMTQ
jgi:uncharacterized protein (DUF58 family)